MYGRIRSAWTQDDDCFNWQVTIPANTTATISIPAKKASLVTESGQPLENAIGVTFLHMEHDVAVLRLVSGRYNFSSSME
jgi:alpha-L-rhamnosidase